MTGPRVSSAQGSLFSLEERLRRTLGLAGLIEAGFDPTALPVVLVDDATRPGAQTYRGRAWWDQVLVTLTGGGVVSSAAWEALVPQIIEEITFNPRDSGSVFPATDFSEFYVAIHLAAPGTVPTYAVATAAGLFCEINISNQDRPGLERGLGPLWGASGVWGQFGCRAGETLSVPTRIFLPQGGFMAINFSTNSVAAVNGNLAITVKGRIF